MPFDVKVSELHRDIIKRMTMIIVDIKIIIIIIIVIIIIIFCCVEI